jgi:hypothetical protein
MMKYTINVNNMWLIGSSPKIEMKKSQVCGEVWLMKMIKT